MNNKWQCVIGLEIHAVIKTKAKLFTKSLNNWNSSANTNLNPFDLAIPGALPIINQKCVIQSAKTGLALNCKINNYSAFDRKSYFYPDSPSGYQISQFYHPIAEQGYIELSTLNNKKIRINRLHIEGDAGKSIHERSKTLIDFNRAGVGLMEIVTEPDIRSSQEAIETLSNIIKILQYCDTSNAAMAEGSIRCDVNISLHKPNTPFGTRVEIKNLNSLTSINDAIKHEIKRQTEVLEKNGEVYQETRLWDIDKNQTIIMRSKEDATDYRYFPDPNLNPIYLSDEEIEEIQNTIPVLHSKREQKYINSYQIAEDNAVFLCSKKEISDYFDKTIEAKPNIPPKKIANWIISVLYGILNKENISINESKLKYNHLAEIIEYTESNQISSSSGKKVLTQIHSTGENVKELIEKLNLWQISDVKLITQWTSEVIAEHTQIVEKFLSGKDNVKKSLMGMIIKKSKGKADPVITTQILEEELNKLKTT